MTPEEVAQLVRAEIGEDWGRTNLHRVDLKRCLVPPTQFTALDARERDVPLWLVLHAIPGGGNGWAVAFHEPSRQFGLVQFAEGYEPMLAGFHSSFFEALDAM